MHPTDTAREARIHGPPPAVAPDIRVGFVLSPAFTLLPFAGFADTLRHAADEGDRSRQIHCHWIILGASLDPVRSSCGAEVLPWRTYGDPGEFDYIVVVGGLMSAFGRHAPETFDFLRLAAARHVSVVGLCTGSFAMAEAGLLQDRRCAVHVRHREEFIARYPDVTVTTQELYVSDGDRITCPGGTAAIDVAVELVMHHAGKARALKGLTEMVVDEHRIAMHQPRTPHEDLLDCGDWRVEHAVRLMQGSLSAPCSSQDLARRVGISVSQLDRAFTGCCRMTAAEVWRDMRLLHAKWLLLNTDRTVARVAQECGFADASHLYRWFRRAFNESPRNFRRGRHVAPVEVRMSHGSP